MREAVFQGICQTETILGLLAAAWFFSVLCRGLLGEETGRHKRLWLAPGAYFAVAYLLYVIPVAMSSFTAYLLGTLAAFLALVFVCKAPFYRGLFLSVTFFSLRWQETSIAGRVSLALFEAASLFLNWATEGKFALSWQWNIAHIAVNAALSLLMEALGFLLLAKCLTGKFDWKARELSQKEKLFLLTPGVFGSVCYFVFHWIIVKYDLSDGAGIFQEYPYFSAMLICVNALMLLSTWVVLSLFADLEKKKEEQTRRAVQQSQIQKLREHLQEMEQVYSGIQGMKHDLKNHIAVLQELLAAEQFQEAKDYLQPMARTAEAMDYTYKTGNPVTDVIIQEKYRRAAALGITFESGFHFPARSGIDVFDISVILNNALENALEAAAKTERGYIRITSSRQKKMFLLETVNSFQGHLELDPLSGLPKSSKAGENLHGVGLKNIRRVAEDYRGAVEVEAQGKEFTLTVMLQEVWDGG